jgi:hypothetical protein
LTWFPVSGIIEAFHQPASREADAVKTASGGLVKVELGERRAGPRSSRAGIDKET